MTSDTDCFFCTGSMQSPINTSYLRHSIGFFFHVATEYWKVFLLRSCTLDLLKFPCFLMTKSMSSLIHPVGVTTSHLCCHRGTSWKLPHATVYPILWIIGSILQRGYAKHNPITKTPFGIRHLNHLPGNGGAEKVCKGQQASQSLAAARSHAATK